MQFTLINLQHDEISLPEALIDVGSVNMFKQLVSLILLAVGLLYCI